MKKNIAKFPPIAEDKIALSHGNQDLLGEGILKLEGAEFMRKKL